MTERTVLEALSIFVASQPTKRVWTFLDDAGEELDVATTGLANHLLKSCQLKEGDRVLLVFFPGLAFTASLIACFKAGLVAVPVFPPDPRRLQKDLDHFVSIQSSSEAKVALTHTPYNFAKKVADLTRMFSTKGEKSWPDIRWIAVDDVLSKERKTLKVNTVAPVLRPTSEIAFLQYTSGSTSEPKGVMITHRNLAHNLTLIIHELKANTSTVNVSWLPQYHDMGLIGSYLGCLYCGGTGFYLSPVSFLKDPTVWLRSISRYRGTHTQAPNFAYALAVRKHKESKRGKGSHESLRMDLSTLQHMINAAEPVDSDAIADFYATFEPFGLPPGVVVPTYGLAEHTVFVCSGGCSLLQLDKAALEGGRVVVLTEGLLSTGSAAAAGSGGGGKIVYDLSEPVTGGCVIDITNCGVGSFVAPRGGSAGSATADGKASSEEEKTSTVAAAGGGRGVAAGSGNIQSMVGCGFPGRADGVDLIIVNPESMQVQPPDVVGEIWVTSPSKANGYWNQPQLSQENFQARVTVTAADGESASASSGVGFLRTGDLGFVRKGELFICGRLKDLIIVRGANHYPQDIERTAERSHPAFRPGCSAAFAVKHEEGHTETVVYVAEVKPGIPAADLPAAIDACRRAITADHGLALTCVCILEPRTVEKTTSGKIARAWCRRAFLSGTLKILKRWDGLPGAGEDLAQAQGEPYSPETRGPRAGGAVVGDGEGVAGEGEGEGGGMESIPRMSASEMRAQTPAAIVGMLQNTLVQISAQGPSPLSPPVDPSLSLISLGLDSFTIVQFKGVLEKRFHCDVPDEFLFTDLATVDEVAEAVKAGGLTAQQKEQLESGVKVMGPGDGPGGAAGGKSTVIPVNHKQPLCPWFTCCY